MPARRPRITVVLDESTVETLKRLAAVEDRSVSAIVAEILETFEPGLERAAEVGERFHAMAASQKDAMRRAIAFAEESVAGPLNEAFKAVSAVYEMSKEGAGAGDALAPTPADLDSRRGGVFSKTRAERPPLGNTGVT